MRGDTAFKILLPPGWRGGYTAAPAVPPETLGLRPGSVVTGRNREVHGRRTIGLASSGLGRAWPVGMSLSHHAPATPVAGRVQCALTNSVSSNTLVWLASGLAVRCVQKQCGLVGSLTARTHDFQPSSLPSSYGNCSDETR